MNSGDFESPASPTEVQETANASSPYTVAAAPSPINCQATTSPISSVGNNISDSPSNSQASSNSTNQGSMKVSAPVIANDMNLTNASRKVPMVMVPVTDSRALMAIPIPLNHLKDVHMDTLKDEQQARDLLSWNDGIGTLNGCDLRFKVNQLGCLELLDSDDESENQTMSKVPKSKSYDAISTTINQSSNHNGSGDNTKAPTGVCKLTTNTNTISPPTNMTTSNGLSDSQQHQSSTNDRLSKRIKIDPEPAPIRQISPGSSLLRDGPNTRRPKSGTNSSLTGRGQSNSLSLLKKLEQNQNLVLIEKLVSKQRLDEIKTNVLHWTIEDVKNFVDSIPGCSGYGELFESQQICGKSLMYLDQRDLLDVINVKLGPAVKIYHAISLLK